MNKPPKIQQIFLNSYEDFRSSVSHMSGVQEKAATAILNCKSGSLGCNISQCTDCGNGAFDPPEKARSFLSALFPFLLFEVRDQHRVSEEEKPVSLPHRLPVGGDALTGGGEPGQAADDSDALVALSRKVA